MPTNPNEHRPPFQAESSTDPQIHHDAANRMEADERLSTGQIIRSLNGYYHLTMQADGNLVLYDLFGQPYWASNINGSDAKYAIMQQDGNLVLYNEHGQARWATNTPGNLGAHLILQNDRNLVIYQGTQPLWASNTMADPLSQTILKKYLEVNNDPSLKLGQPTESLKQCPDGVGWYQHFKSASIYAHPLVGTWIVRIPIRDKWAEMGWERGNFKYPITDTMHSDIAEFVYHQKFQGATVYWKQGMFKVNRITKFD